MRWTAVLICGWASLAGLVLLQKSLPASWWMDVGRVEVRASDDPDGCFPMEVDRTINREFYARWTVTVMRQNAESGYYTYRTYAGANDYRPDNELPDDLDLCWWTGADQIEFAPGVYRVHTFWKLEVNGGVRQIRRKSSSFEIGQSPTG